MIFASFEFLFLFLPAFFLTYFVLPARLRNWAILLFSWGFYAWWRVDFLALLVGVTAWSFVLARILDATPTSRGRNRLLLLGLAGQLGVLAYFKYANFGVQTFNDLISLAGGTPAPWAQIILPVGLSFYVLQSVSYLMDVWRRDVAVSRDFIAYAAYKAMFSQLIAGPIVRYSEIEYDLRHRVHTVEKFGLGARRFMIGFAMKVLIADTIAPVVDAVYALDNPTTADAWTGAIAYTLQLFFDFAGYSAMAIGLATMCAFRFPENFNNPYLAANIQEFWQRWHMTLSRFLRDYLYISLGGNRGGPVRTYVNLLLTMVIGGLWHGAAWTFVLWGFWHGALLALHRFWRARGHGPLGWLPGHALLILAVILGWVAFRAPSFESAFTLYAAMFGQNFGGISDALAWQVTLDQWWCMWLGILLVYVPLLGDRLPVLCQQPDRVTGLWRPVWAYWPLAAFVLGMVLLYSRAAVPFLYFQF
jgi:alginate O-acetyltransferase complex protein AlgI